MGDQQEIRDVLGGAIARLSLCLGTLRRLPRSTVPADYQDVDQCLAHQGDYECKKDFPRQDIREQAVAL